MSHIQLWRTEIGPARGRPGCKRPEVKGKQVALQSSSNISYSMGHISSPGTVPEQHVAQSYPACSTVCIRVSTYKVYQEI